MTQFSESEEYQIKLICDDTVYMMFDLDNGNMISRNGDGIIVIDEVWKFSYKRQLISETIENNIKHTLNNFFITVWYNDSIILDFDTYAAEVKFKVRTFEGFHANMFLNVLDDYRKKMFNV